MQLVLSGAVDNGLGLTPPMGFNPYNHFGGEYKSYDEALLNKQIVDAVSGVDWTPRFGV
jgi:hypothetical protein